VGKDVMARRLHELSPRRAGPFVPINCAAIPEALFESEIFGHERGAFTGATDRTTGKVQMADGGTLFLDEIAEMPLGLQTKLLRFLESRRYMRVGGAAKLEADVRLVFATLRPLALEVKAGRFRPDLYYRIQGIVLEIPPLRERRADIPELLDTFLEQLSATHDVAPPRFTRAARTTLVGYDWPGNVRELRNVVEILCILCEGRRVRVDDLPLAVRAVAPTADRVTVILDRPLQTMVDELVQAVITAEGGNLARAARRLEVSVRTLQRRRS
jgi:DNA-binding NtrC family response regulator